MLAKTLLFGLLVTVAVGAPAPSPFWRILGDSFKDSLSTLQSGFTQLSTPLTAAVSGIPESIGKGASAVTSGVGTLYNSGKKAADTTLNAGAGVIGATIKVPATLAANKMALVGSGISNIDKINKSLLDGTIKIGKAAATSVGNGIEAASKIGAAGLGVVEGGIKSGITLGTEVNKMAIGTADSIGNGISTGVTNTAGKVADMITDTSSKITGVANKVATQVVDSTKNTVDGIMKTATESAKTASDLTNNGVNTVTSAVEKATDSAKDLVKAAETQAGSVVENGVSAATDATNKALAAGEKVVTETNAAATSAVKTATDTTNKALTAETQVATS